MKRFLLETLGMFIAFALGAQAQVSQTASVLDGSGRQLSGGTFSGVTAAGQPGGIAVSSAGGVVNYAGFLNTFSLQPALDTDQDGLEDEVDVDNDNDALSDETELTGSAFSPVTPTDHNVADSDGDGTDDGEESVAGTDPTDPGAYLRILSVDVGGGLADVTWRSRSGKLYHVHGQDTVSGLPGLPVATNMAFGGSAPWFVTTNSYSEATAGGVSNWYFAVEALP